MISEHFRYLVTILPKHVIKLPSLQPSDVG